MKGKPKIMRIISPTSSKHIGSKITLNNRHRMISIGYLLKEIIIFPVQMPHAFIIFFPAITKKTMINTKMKTFILCLRRMSVNRSVISFAISNPTNIKIINISTFASPVTNSITTTHTATNKVIFSDINNFYPSCLVLCLIK